MSELIVIGYDNHDQATSAYNEVLALQGDFVVELQGLAIVTVDAEGKSHVETPQKIVGMSAASGALWGMLIGLLFFVPFFGAGPRRPDGCAVRQARQVRHQRRIPLAGQRHAQPGKAAVVIMASKITEDKFADRMTGLRRQAAEDLAVRGGREGTRARAGRGPGPPDRLTGTFEGRPRGSPCGRPFVYPSERNRRATSSRTRRRSSGATG